MKIVKSPEEYSLLTKDVSEAVENEVEEQKGGFLGMLTAILVASWLGNMLAGKVVIRAGEITIRAGERQYL